MSINENSFILSDNTNNVGNAGSVVSGGEGSAGSAPDTGGEAYDNSYTDCPVIQKDAGYYFRYYAEAYAPFAVLFVIFAFILVRAKKRNAAYMAKYDLTMERQKQAIDEMKKTNELLTQMLEKLDK